MSTPARHQAAGANRERGFALVVAMLVLLVMTLLGVVLMASVILNRSLAGNDQRMRGALNTAEAGVGEAMARIRNDASLDPADPNSSAQIFNTPAGSVPVLAGDTIAVATAQPAGAYLNYSTPARSPDVLQVGWKKDPTGTKIMHWDGTQNPAIQAISTGFPIYEITSTGRVGTTRRTIVTDVIRKPVIVQAKGALAANVPIGALGNAVVCGFNHFYSTPYDDGMKGQTVNVPPNDPVHCGDNETGQGNVAGIWSSGPVNPGGTFNGYGNPPWTQNQVGFYGGPWEPFGLSQADFWSWVGSPNPNPSKLTGIYYVDNNNVTQDQSADYKLQSVDGEGFLYVDGNLHISSNFHYVGLIYVEGDFDINGNAWVLGGVIVNGKTTITANGGMTLLYSSDAITQSISKYGGQFVTLSWREK
jgi:type IV pilus assembly protein PilX